MLQLRQGWCISPNQTLHAALCSPTAKSSGKSCHAYCWVQRLKISWMQVLTKSPLKALHWDKIRVPQPGTVWTSEKQGSSALNLEALDSLFQVALHLNELCA